MKNTAKTFLTLAALTYITTHEVEAQNKPSVTPQAGKPCNPDPAVPCIGDPPKGGTPKSSPRVTGSRPAWRGDMVGRDLKFILIPYVGHVGVVTSYNPANLTDDQIFVLEMSHDHSRNPEIVTFSAFRHKTVYWGAVHGNWPDIRLDTYCDNGNYYPLNFQPGYCMSLESYGSLVTPAGAILNRALAIYRVDGNEYTYTAVSTPMKPASCDTNYCYGAVRGIYRCDTFVYDAYRRATGDLNLGAPQDFSGYVSFMSPITIYNKFVSR
jgi:hypothetical protein